MKIPSIITLVLCGLGMVQSAQAVPITVTLDAVKDCEVKAPFPDSAFSSSLNLQSLKTATLSNNTGYFAQFQLPADCNVPTITDLTWTNVVSETAAGSNGLYVLAIRQAAENTMGDLNALTWNTAPAIKKSAHTPSDSLQYDYGTSLLVCYKGYSATVGDETSISINSSGNAVYWGNTATTLNADTDRILTFYYHERYVRDICPRFASIENGTYHGPQLTITYPSNGLGLGIILEELDDTTVLYEEGLTSHAYTLVLDDVPDFDVQIAINSDGLTNVVPSVLTFDQNDWNVPQMVTISAVDESIDQSPDLYSSVISHVVTSQDTYFSGINIPNITLDVYDNDGPCDPSEYLPEDIVKDCRINMDDFLSLVAEWLTCTDPANPGVCE